jgi:hypothetical protein
MVASLAPLRTLLNGGGKPCSRHRRCVALVLLVVFFTVIYWFLLREQSPMATLLPAQPIYREGEPVWLQLRIANLSTHRIQVDDPIGLHGGALELNGPPSLNKAIPNTGGPSSVVISWAADRVAIEPGADYLMQIRLDELVEGLRRGDYSIGYRLIVPYRSPEQRLAAPLKWLNQCAGYLTDEVVMDSEEDGHFAIVAEGVLRFRIREK